MDTKNWASMAVKADAVFNILPTNDMCDPQYAVQIPNRTEATKTGHLEIFQIVPLSPGTLPSFSARWDGKMNTIDIDLIGDKKAAFLFKCGIWGYQGHHAVAVSTSPRIFQIDIRIPGVRVYQAEVSLNINISAKVSDDVGQHFSDSVDRILM